MRTGRCLASPSRPQCARAKLARRPGMERPYEKVKELMRGHQIAQEDVERFIDSLDFDSETAARLKTLTPATYVGVAAQLVDFDR